jgi:hypothetical protein
MRLLRITETHDYDLIGTLLSSTEREVVPHMPPPTLISIAPSQLPAR